MRKSFFLLLALFICKISFAQVKVQQLLTESQSNPINIDAPVPGFSWKLDAGARHNVVQTAYEIKVTTYAYLKKGKHEVWNSGKVMSGQSVYVPYKGQPLISGKKYYWQLRVWDNTGKPSEWSVPA